MYERIATRILMTLGIIAVILVIWMMGIIALKETKLALIPKTSNEYFDEYDGYFVIRKWGTYKYEHNKLEYLGQ